jgi:phosphatidylserine/phosphatidylglycerophosphate/cardiolipin synthase-like enzyme
MSGEMILTRAGSVAEAIERLIRETSHSVDVALYRLNHPRLARALESAQERGLRVRVVLDRNKYEESRSTRELLANGRIPLRLSYGRRGPGSKMHHKFAILDDRTAMTGSYNWTLESEEQNYESLLILDEPQHLEAYRREFEALWSKAEEIRGP